MFKGVLQMKSIIPIEFSNQRVLTTQQLASFYETDTTRISQNYIRNLDRYIPGIHNFKIEGEELKAFKADYQIDSALNASSIMLWTEKGALLHAKSLNTDKAWEVYQELVDTYFRVKQDKPQCIEDLIIMQAQSMKELRTEVKQLQTTTQTIKDTIVTQPDNWREDLNRMFNKIALTVGQNKFKDLRHESYKRLEQRAHVDLERRLDNLRARMIKEGLSNTKITQANKLDVIEQDPKLREIYAKIIQEYTVKFVA